MKRHIPTRTTRALALIAAALTLGVLGTAPRAANGPALQSISEQPLPGQQLQVTLHFSGAPPQPLSFTIDNPPRLSIDLPNATLALPSRHIDVYSGGIQNILAAEAKDRSRVVVQLDRMLPYQMEVSGNDVVVTLGAVSAAAAASPQTAAAAAGAAAQPDQPEQAPAGPRAIRSIDFRRSTDGAGRVIVNLTDPHTQINLRQLGDQLVVDFADTALPPTGARRYDATDFGTPVRGFDVSQSGNDTRIVIDATGNYEQLAYQTDNQYVVEVQPQRRAATAPEQARKYTGQRLTLNFQDIDTRAVLQLLAEASGQNIVVSDSVRGSVTLRLQNVPWDQALDIVLRTKGLDKRQDGNVIIVAPAEELAAREKAEFAASKDLQELEPLRSEFIQVNYAKAADIALLIRPRAGAGGGGGGTAAGAGSLLSARGSVSVDARTNTLLVQDTAERVADIRRLVATLDIPIRQVQIEARVVTVTDDFERELGTVLGFTGVTKNGPGIVTTTGSAAGIDSIVSSTISGTGFPGSIPTATSRYNVNLPTPDAGGSIAFGVLGSDYLVDLELSAAQLETRADVISAPRVVTANQKKAVILQGTEIPYQESASSGATTVQFENAVLSLTVTPQITPDNRIILDLDVRDDSVGTVVVESGGINVPSINTQEVTDQVVVNDGQTVVLGGILETTHRDQETKIPVLGDIPLLGNLFKQTIKTNDKDELLIFVTPKIVHEGTTVY